MAVAARDRRVLGRKAAFSVRPSRKRVLNFWKNKAWDSRARIARWLSHGNRSPHLLRADPAHARLWAVARLCRQCGAAVRLAVAQARRCPASFRSSWRRGGSRQAALRAASILGDHGPGGRGLQPFQRRAEIFLALTIEALLVSPETGDPGANFRLHVALQIKL